MSDLLKINVNDHVEKKGNLSYLSWAWAWAEVLKIDPGAQWHLRRRTSSKSSRQQGGSVSHQFCTTRFRRIPSKPCRVHHQSSGSRPSF